MSHPGITSRRFLEVTQWTFLPEGLVILNSDFPNDRIHRVRYQDVFRVAAGRYFSTALFVACCLLALFVMIITALRQFHPLLVLVSLASLASLVAVGVMKTSVIVVESLGGVFRIRKFCLSQAKMEQLLSVLLENVAREQGVEATPLDGENGVPAAPATSSA